MKPVPRYTDRDGAASEADGEVVLIAGGRKPNTAGLGIENAGVRVSKRGFVEVDGERRFRYVQALAVDEGCLECHGEPVGGVRALPLPGPTTGTTVGTAPHVAP